MGWKSTMNITREDAISEIMRHIMKCSDGYLGDALENILDGVSYCKCPYNFSIVSNYNEDEMYNYYPGRI